MAGANSLDPFAQDYYNAARRRVDDTYQIGLTNNNDRQQQADMTFQQRLQGLQDRLDQERNQLPDAYAAHGLINSGIYNYGSQPGQSGGMGALQRFQLNYNTQLGDLRNQQTSVDTQYGHQGQQLGQTYHDQLGALSTQQADDVARQSIADAISGA